MKHDLDTALDQCLDSLRQSRDLEACLASYPQYADELRPLLDLAIDVGWVSAPAPTAAARVAGEERMLAALARAAEQRAQLHPLVRAFKGFIGFFARPAPSFGWAWRWAAAMMAVLLVAACGLALTASAGSLPGDTLYPLKLAGQRAQLALTFDPASQRLLADRFDAQQRSDVEAVLSMGRRAAVEFRGILERMEDAIWIVGGLPVTVDAATTVVGQPHVGASLRVRGELPGDGVLLAIRVEVESDVTPLPTPSPQPTRTPLPSATPAPTGMPQPAATAQGGASEREDMGETPLPQMTGSPAPGDGREAGEVSATPNVQEPAHTPEVQETPDSIDGPQPDATPEPGDTPESIVEPDPDDQPEPEDTPESIDEPDPDDQPEPEDTPDSIDEPDPDDQPEPEDTPESIDEPDPDDQPEPEHTPESIDEPNPDDQPEPEDTPDTLDMPEPGETEEATTTSSAASIARLSPDAGILIWRVRCDDDHTIHGGEF